MRNVNSIILELSVNTNRDKIRPGLTFAASALSALGHETRLSVFRLLVQAGSAGLQPGRMAQLIGLPASSLSFHLMHLQHAGLVGARREGRGLIYTVHYDVMEGLMAYLQENCCGGVGEASPPVRKRKASAKIEA
jgi:DNA-binding transcriptional ArsR family regulator